MSSAFDRDFPKVSLEEMDRIPQSIKGYIWGACLCLCLVLLIGAPTSAKTQNVKSQSELLGREPLPSEMSGRLSNLDCMLLPLECPLEQQASPRFVNPFRGGSPTVYNSSSPQSTNAPVRGTLFASSALPVPDAPKAPQEAPAPEQAQQKSYLDIYGFVMLDMGYDVKVNDPNWFDVNRPSKLPAVPGEFGKDGNTYFGVRQSRFGVKGSQYTTLGELKYEFEFDLFGVGVDAGQTTIRPRHFFGELGPVLAGQTNSVFMDIDVFPNVIEYWGPNGMVFLRNPQLRFTPLNGHTALMFALEKPGASGDAGLLADRIDLSNIRARFQYPDLTGAISHTWENKSYIRFAGIVRNTKIDNLANGLTRSITGWGVNGSSNIHFGKDVLRLQYVVGNGIENYMNDAPTDVAPELRVSNSVLTLRGKPIPMHSFSAYLDHSWSDRWTTSLGYSALWMSNTNLQTPDAFHKGDYASLNLLYSPFKSFLAGGEFQYGKRTNSSSGFNPNDYRVQFSFKYSWDFRVLGK